MPNFSSKSHQKMYPEQAPCRTLAAQLSAGAELPAITVPLLEVGGMPLGVQLLAQPHADHELLALGCWLAEASMQRLALRSPR